MNTDVCMYVCVYVSRDEIACEERRGEENPEGKWDRTAYLPTYYVGSLTKLLYQHKHREREGFPF